MISYSRSSALGAVCSFLVLTAPLMAQYEEPDSTNVVRMPTVVVTGTAVAASPLLVGYAISVITAEALRAEPQNYVSGVLQDIPGAFVDEANGPGGPTIVRLRGGEETFTQIIADGVQINQNGGFFDLQGFPLTNIERIEVSRGPQSALYGSSAVSGVVQLVTRRGQVGRPRMRFSAGGGGAAENGGTLSSELGVSGGTPSVQYSLGGGYSYNRGIFALPNDLRSRDGVARIDITPAGPFSATVTSRLMNYESLLPVRDPGATRVPLDPNARNERTRSISSVRSVYSPSESWTNQLTVAHYFEDFTFQDTGDNVAAGLALPFFVFDATFDFFSKLNRTSIDYLGTNTITPNGTTSLSLSYGFRLERERLADEIAGDFGNSMNSFDRNSGAFLTEVAVRVTDAVNIQAGGRLEKYEGIDPIVTPRLNVRVGPTGQPFAIRGSVGRAFKAPNLQEQFLSNPFIVSNPDLKPETSWSFELGIDYLAGGGTLAASATAYTQTYDNLIRSVGLNDGTGRGINRNLGESRSRGLEVEVSYRASDRVVVEVSNAWFETEIIDNVGLSAAEFPVGEGLPFRPSYRGSAALRINPTDKLTATVRGVFVGGQTVLAERFSGNREVVDGYGLINLAINYEVDRAISVYSVVNNLLDTAYQTAFDRRGIPFTFGGGVRVEP